MTRQEIQIDYDYYNRESGYEDLKEAVDSLTLSTEEEFNEIKKEKWFNRLFDIITFSKKNEKRMASQIGNLAQAQELLMEILLRLSNRDSKISELVKESYEKLERLSEQDIILARKVKSLEDRYLLGIDKQSDILDLSETNKQILGGTIKYMMSKFETISEEQQNFANKILNYLGVNPQDIDLEKSIESIDSLDSKKKIFTCSMEYGFLNEFNFDFMDELDQLLDEFDFGRKTISEVKNNISNTYKLRGVNGFVDKYIEYDYEDIGEEFYIDLEEDFIIEETEAEKTDIEIANILHIEEGESKSFSNSIVHINTYINCQGNLVFDNCHVYYNEDLASEISLDEGASLQFINSKIISSESKEEFFIKAQSNSMLRLENCELVDCSYFIESHSDSKIIMDKCVLENPNNSFIRGYRDAELAITNTVINLACSKLNESLISISGDATFKEIIVNGNEELLKSDDNIWIFEADRARFENCSFNQVKASIYGAQEISKCIFTQCIDVIHLRDSFFHEGESSRVTNCIFHECENVIEAGENSEITNSQFSQCRNRIISTGYSGSVTIEYCEFYNISFNKDVTFSEDACLYFQRTKDKNSNGSKLRKCIFDGIDLGEGFLIIGDIFEKVNGPTVHVEDCSFRHCVTERDSGKIIKEYDSYYGLFNKKTEVQTVSISNCSGLDRVNKENGYNEDIIIKGETPKGVKIGSSLEGLLLKGPVTGLIAGNIAETFFTDSDLHQE